MPKGSCLCGRVTYQYSGQSKVFQYCHCSRCQKFTGSAHASNIIIDTDQFEWTSGEELVGRFEHPEAKYFATGFCKHCGSSLPWASKTGHAMVVPAGTLDEDPGERPRWNIFVADRAAWYEHPDTLPEHQGLPGKPARGKT